MKKYLHYFLIVAPVVLVAVAFVVKDTSALTDTDISPPSPDRSICSNAITSYDPPSTKSTCRGAEASSYIACAGENDKICKTTVGPGQWGVDYGCTQFDCMDLMGIPNTEEITNVGWFKFDGNATTKGYGPKLDGKCKKAFVISNPDPGGGAPKLLSDSPFASKQECESAATSPPSPDDTCTMDVWSCSSWNTCSAEGAQTRTCGLTYDCKNTDQPSKPTESKSCTVTEPDPEPDPKPDPTQCPRKPDSAKGTGEPAALPSGAKIKQVPSYYIWGCYSQPDKTNNSECTAQATKRTGNITSPCVFGQESIVCPSKGTAYKEGNFLKCAPVKLPKNEERRDDDRNNGRSTETTVITQTVERIVTVEVPSATSIVPPEMVTDESCKIYKEEVDEKVVSQGDAFLNAADAAFKSTAVNNPAFKKVFYGMLKESAKKSRKLQKLVNSKTCNAEAVSELHSTVKDFEAGELEKVKQTLAFLDKETKVQNQYVGINEDFKWIEKFAKSLKPGSAQTTLFVEEMGTFEQLRSDFQDILNAEKEGKVFGFEVEAVALQAKELRKSIEKKTSQISFGGKKKTSVKKKSAASKKTVKKKSTKKKSTKKKSAKKSTKKTTKKKSTKKSK